jgi:transcriptional regulator with XRE-family HTH domain
MSQQELASQLNVTSQAISKWENNISEPEFQIIQKITEIFKISHDDLFVGDTDVLYKGSIYTASKDTRMKKYYDFFLGLTAILSLALMITTVYISTLEILTWHFTFGLGLLTLYMLFLLFIVSSWRYKYKKSPSELLDVYQDKIVVNESNLTIYDYKIKKFEIRKYNFYTGIRVYEDTGYLKIWTNDNQIIMVRDIKEVHDLKNVFFKMKSKNIKEEY